MSESCFSETQSTAFLFLLINGGIKFLPSTDPPTHTPPPAPSSFMDLLCLFVLQATAIIVRDRT